MFSKIPAAISFNKAHQMINSKCRSHIFAELSTLNKKGKLFLEKNKKKKKKKRNEGLLRRSTILNITDFCELVRKTYQDMNRTFQTEFTCGLTEY